MLSVNAITGSRPRHNESGWPVASLVTLLSQLKCLKIVWDPVLGGWVDSQIRTGWTNKSGFSWELNPGLA